MDKIDISEGTIEAGMAAVKGWVGPNRTPEEKLVVQRVETT